MEIPQRPRTSSTERCARGRREPVMAAVGKRQSTELALRIDSGPMGIYDYTIQSISGPRGLAGRLGASHIVLCLFFLIVNLECVWPWLDREWHGSDSCYWGVL